MIIQCPACATRYVVPDTAIGVDGRTVRCAKCRNSWFQDGPDPAPSAEASPSPVPTPTPVPTPAPPSEPAPEPEAAAAPEGSVEPEAAPARRFAAPEPDAAPEPNTADASDTPADEPRAGGGDFAEPPAAPPPPVASVRVSDEPVSQFEAAPPFRRRHNPLRMWTWAAAIFAAVAAGLIVAVSYFGLPDWVPVSRPTFAAAQPDLQLDFPAEQQEQRQLPNGTEFFGASGTVTNIGTEVRALPPILIVLRDARNRIVYSWEVPPPQRTLAPGETITINEAVTDIPRSARFAEIGWKPE